MTKSTMQLLENNRKTHRALQQGKQNDNSRMDDSNDDGDDEKSIKEMLEEILGKEPWKGQRASKMDLDDFLQLLSEFNDAGIHFC